MRGHGDDGVPVIELDGVSKAFGSVQALADVSLRLYGGEVHGLAGENGARKSTLIKVLTGVYPPDSGTVRQDGEAVAFHGPADARDAGVALASGQINGAQGQTFSAGSLGTFTIGPNGVVTLGQPQVFDASNIDQFNF